MRIHKLFIIFTLFFLFAGFNITFSQSKLQIGFDIRDEYVREVYTAVVKSKYNNDNNEYLFELPAIDFLALYSISKDYSLELNAGYEFLHIIIPDGFITGPVFGISARRKIIDNWLYGRLNFTLHFNRRGGHVSMTGGAQSFETAFPMMGLGVDIYTSENISFNLMFVKLLKEKIAYSFNYGEDKEEQTLEKVIGEYKRPYLIKFGFSFYWDIL